MSFGIFDIVTKFEAPSWVCFGYFDPSGLALYYGYDTINNASNIERLKKNPAFKTMTDAYAGVQIVFSILSIHTNENDAQYANHQRLQIYYPPANRPVERTRGFVRCTTDGLLFVSQSAAAKYYEMTVGAVSNHLNGRPGFQAPHGKTFEYVHGVPQDGTKVIDIRGELVAVESIRVRKV